MTTDRQTIAHLHNERRFCYISKKKNILVDEQGFSPFIFEFLNLRLGVESEYKERGGRTIIF